ncbi:FAD-dependent oxidoreductase [Chitinophaga cymbidii]|uniref:Golvesin/Xly CBD-like domain-containing protein n=1 Tax=Chitinophaga cymbidii TaxID=1096750 RepID=A0A512RFV5_9BACT|nr:FAD-dependent oxidoreductase [Chitinophaga cymbidii]GEP94597.1 hypothetical protein CCY01nite_08570 [Chitinophaga cymbidii]
MRKLIFSISTLFITCAAGAQQKVPVSIAMGTVQQQLQRMTAQQTDVTKYPRTIKDGITRTVKSSDWTSGFFPGTLWYLYEYTGDAKWETLARQWTAGLEKEKRNKGTHDLGFMMYCPFGNGYRLTQDPAYRQVLLESAASLASRFNAKTGTLKSWDKKEFHFPVIIDNMMNLELLFWATRVTGDSSYYKIAVSHADQTMKHHFRKNYSSYHVVDYDSVTGQPLRKITHQGYSDHSAWARGQAWGLYGYTMAYRFTQDQRYLQQAEKIAAFYLGKLPKDKVPYWDFDAPRSSKPPRDASAAAITASALLELSKYTNNKKYFTAAEDMLVSLCSTTYMAAPGSNNYFLLKHSTGHMPHRSEIDVPINYADYYFVEALLRYQPVQSIKKADVVVYTGNPGGITAAIAAAREGASVLLVEPSPYLGGIVAQGGLCVSDIGHHETIGGLAKNFFQQTADYYRTTYGERSEQWKASVVEGLPGASFEPKVGELVFEQMLKAYPSIKIVRNVSLVKTWQQGKQIHAITCKNLQTGDTVHLQGKVFVDASYTADLVAMAKVSYLLGTEGKHVFGEPSVPDQSSRAIQAFNYRVTMSNDPANMVAVSKPAAYDAAAYDIRLAGLLKDSTTRVFKTYWKLPNKKIDANIADFPGVNWTYPEADYAARAALEAKHRNNSLGYIYFLQNDPRVPMRMQKEARTWGLAKDEFTDNGNFPRHIYIREGRRLNGAYVMRQQDLQQDREKPDAIALGSYSMDSHATTVIRKSDGTLGYSGGGIWEPVKAYEIAYRALVPKATECTNLLVPVCMSSTHMAWTSLRMEPVFMMTGEAAGIAAAMAFAHNTTVQNVHTATLRQHLKKHGALVNLLPETVADFEWQPRAPRVGETVTFTVKTKPGNTQPVRCYWDFDGDGKPDANTLEVKQTMKADKVQLVSLVVEDASGKRSLPFARTVKAGNGKGGDIQIDSEDSTHARLKLVKKAMAQTPYWGNFYHTDGNVMKGKSSATYLPDIEKAGKYDVYVSTVPGNGRSSHTLVELAHAKGTERIYIDQRKGDPLFGLIFLGRFEFRPGGAASLTIRNNDHGKYILYDVARWVLRSTN